MICPLGIGFKYVAGQIIIANQGPELAMVSYFLRLFLRE
jgi:hypothetical protein